MSRSVVHKNMRPEFKAVLLSNFGNNWLRIKRTIGSLISKLLRDERYLYHDLILHPVDTENRWDGSDAQVLKR